MLVAWAVFICVIRASAIMPEAAMKLGGRKLYVQPGVNSFAASDMPGNYYLKSAADAVSGLCGLGETGAAPSHRRISTIHHNGRSGHK